MKSRSSIFCGFQKFRNPSKDIAGTFDRDNACDFAFEVKSIYTVFANRFLTRTRSVHSTVKGHVSTFANDMRARIEDIHQKLKKNMHCSY